MIDTFDLPSELTLGGSENRRAPLPDQLRQRRTATEILKRFRTQPGVILADEVGMGKTFVALAVAHAIGSRSRKGPVVVMAPPNLLEKWRADLEAFCNLYLSEVQAVDRARSTLTGKRQGTVFRFGVARHSIEFLKLLDDSPRERCHVILLAQGAMSRAQTDPWVRLALIREVFRRHGRRERLRLVKPQIHRFLGRLLHALGQQQGAIDGDEIWIRLLKEDPQNWKATFNAQTKSEKRQLDDDPVPASICRVLPQIDVELLAEAIAEMPVRARGGEERVNERIDQALADIERRMKLARNKGDSKDVESLRTEKVAFEATKDFTRINSKVVQARHARAVKNLQAALKRAQKDYVRLGLDQRAADMEREMKGAEGALASGSGAERLPTGELIDLLEMVEVPENVVRGVWKKWKEGLTCERMPHARVMLPVAVEGGYTLKCRFTKRVGTEWVALLLPIGSESCIVIIDGYGGTHSGIATVDNKNLLQLVGTPAVVKTAAGQLQTGEVHELTVVVSVRRDMYEVAAAFDGRGFVTASGPSSRFGLIGHDSLPCIRSPGVEAFDCVVDFHSIELKLDKNAEGYRLGDT